MDRRTFLLFGVTGVAACYRDATPSSEDEQPQQVIVDRAAQAIGAMRASGRFARLDELLKKAEGVMIFPRVVKASLIFGGEGGNGVLLARGADGKFGAPAFYSLGAASAGFQLGYQEATIVLFFMNKNALRSAVGRSLKLGSDVSVAAGTLGDTGSASAGTTASDVYELVDVGGVFAGVSLDGTVVGTRESFNRAYYGADATTYKIVVENRFDAPGTHALRDALAPR